MTCQRTEAMYRLLELLLGPKLVAVTAGALAAVGGTGWETGLKKNVLVLPVDAYSFASETRRELLSVGDIAGLTYVALAADLLVAVVLGGQSLQRRLNNATTEAEDEVESRFLCECQRPILAKK